MKKILAMVAALSVVMSVVAGGSIAYLTDTAADKNTMTLGNVEIDQLEYERVVENGAWVSTGEKDKYGYTPDKLQDFENDKPLMPAVFAEGVIKWDDRNGSTAENGTGHQQSWAQVGASGSNQLFDDSVKNVQDKFVFVKNTGKSDAYVRTVFAFEQGSIAAENFKDVIMTNTNKDHWSWETAAATAEISGNTYQIWVATYLGPKSNATGILAPGAVSYPSLLQVYMKPQADNDDVKDIDGNGNGKYDILVVSQAVQTAGFSDATTALDEAFGDITATNHPWKDGMPTTEPNPDATPTPAPEQTTPPTEPEDDGILTDEEVAEANKGESEAVESADLYADLSGEKDSPLFVLNENETLHIHNADVTIKGNDAIIMNANSTLAFSNSNFNLDSGKKLIVNNSDTIYPQIIIDMGSVTINKTVVLTEDNVSNYLTNINTGSVMFTNFVE